MNGEGSANVRTDAWGLVSYYLKPVLPFFEEDGVSEVMINRFDQVFIEKFGRKEQVDVRFPGEEHLVTTVHQIANALGQISDPDTHPILDARLNDGSRVCAVLYPTATQGTQISIRVFPKVRLDAEALLKNGALTSEMLEYLRLAVLARGNILVSGGTGSGKTTILNVLSSFIPEEDRVITVEDTRELQVSVKNLVSLEAPRRRAMAADAQNVDMAFLIRTTLRMNPTRILVGEIRDADAATAFLHAINTGHAGTCSTIHANNPEDALVRMQTLVAGQGALPFDVVRTQVRSNLHVVIHAESTPRHGRRIVQISELADGEVKKLWWWDYKRGGHQVNHTAVAASAMLAQAEVFGVGKDL
jgi:pilus assembly protein CpaF